MSSAPPGSGNAGSSAAVRHEIRDLIPDRLAQHARNRPTEPALFRREDSGAFTPLTWAEYQERVNDFAAACIGVGLPVGGAVSIIGESRVEWVLSALGAMNAGGMAAGIYQTATADQVTYILGHCEAMIVVVENAGQWQKIAPAIAAGQLPKLRRVVFMGGELPQDAGQPGNQIVQSWSDFIASGKPFRDSVPKRVAGLLPDQVATIIYTSGTTGTPKGVMLTHHNLAWTGTCAMKIHPSTSDDVLVSYLPLSHIAEQMFSIYLPLTAGARVYFAGGMDKLRETLVAARPTIFLAVPRVWEKFQLALSQKMAEASSVQRRVIAWARDVGLRSGRYRLEHGSPFGLLAIEERLANKLFFSKLKTALGLDRIRVAVSGAAAIRKDVLDFFLSLQLPIYEVYGQSESSGPVTCNGAKPGQTRLGTVGRPIPGSTVKLAPDGEVLFQGPNVFAGYFKDDEGTSAALQGGWLHTGDIGEFDSDGFLRITDRKKDLFKTSGGKYVAPQPIESALRGIPLISQALVIGENRKYVTALLTLDPEQVKRFAAEHNLPTELPAFAANEKVQALVQEHVDRLNRGLQRVETVKRYTLLASDFTIESDEMTPTQKLRRRVILKRYAAEIEAMYPADAGAD